jgi:hypothetical protein|tara:strand:+ start:1142 stop:1819 length:678 start_codon:yes stop_codon:yes gene_type:complete
MATKVYKSAMGRVVDMGALMLENENTRAVGNMNVNARGDILDNANRVVETKNKQVGKHYQRQVTNTTAHVPTTSTRTAKKEHAQKKAAKEKIAKDTTTPAISRSRIVKEKVVNASVLDVYNDERLVSNHDKIQAAEEKIVAPVIETVIEEIPEIESMEELAELEATISELVVDPIVEPAPVELVTKTPIPRGGLAAAIARSQSVKQELMKTPRQLAQTKPGVNKI